MLTYSNQDDNSKRYKVRRYYLPKDIHKNYNAVNHGKNIYGQLIDSVVKRREEIRKLTTEQDEYYTTGCLLDNYQQPLQANCSWSE